MSLTSKAFEMDLLGNRTSYEDNRAGLNLSYDPNNPVNEYPAIGGASLIYDDNGNLTKSENNYIFVYDHDNHLIEVQDPSAQVVAAYTYDALGRRIQEDKGGQVTRFYYDDEHNVIAEYDDAMLPALQRYYIHGAGIDEHLQMSEGSTNYYYLLGPQNTVLGLVNNAGILVESYQYDTYGAPTTVRDGGTGNPYRFTGRRLDFNEGDPAAHVHDLVLYHYRARAYDAFHGRFLQRDAAGYFAGMNLYEYAQSNPIVFVDSFGLSPFQLGDSRPAHPKHDAGAGPYNSQRVRNGDYDIWFKVKAIADGGFLRGYWDASRHLSHYLGNTGRELNINAARLFTSDPGAQELLWNELNDAMKFTEDQHKGEGEKFHLISVKWMGFGARSTAWHLAIGGAFALLEAEVEVLPHCKYKMKYTMHVDDQYNWDPGKVAIIPIVGEINDKDVGRLHLIGLAREYHMIGVYSNEFTWKTGEQLDLHTGKVDRSNGSPR